LRKYEHIFKPFRIGGKTVRNRIEMAPVGPLLAAEGLVTPQLIEWGRTFARGGAGIVTLGESAVNLPAGGRMGGALNLGTDRAVGPLSDYAGAIRKYGALASIQLNCHVERPPAAMTLKDIADVIRSFGDAARRCLAAGLDMVMVHGAHGQLLSRFASPRRNARTDAYGGSLENRSRLAREVLEAIRERVGDRLAVEYRISGEEYVPGGLTLAEQVEFAGMLQDRIDLLHVSAGHLFEPASLPRMIQPAYLPRGMNVPLAAAFKRALKVPVAAVGSLDLDLAEEVLAGGRADMAALARTLIADPECVNKAREGRPDEIRPCVRCNTCIDRTHGHRLPIRCAVNPLAGREAELAVLPPLGRRKKVVVVGGGPAGMEAARAISARGHDVILFEEQRRLGGTLHIAAAPPFKADMKRYLDWALRTTTGTPGITVRLSTAATEGTVRAEKPDAVIIAAGATPVVPEIGSTDGARVITAGEAIKGAAVGGRVVVVGVGLTGSETALYLAQQGKSVTILDMLPLEQVDAGYPFINILALRTMLRELGVDTRPETTFKGITGEGVIIADKNGAAAGIPCDTVVLALGIRPRTETVAMLTGLAPATRFAGDCTDTLNNLFGAVAEGFQAGIEI
jgi:2,4-dienoyl-CoA reductase-like NADH-dependent reductase (Old Yellow Enzyme family)/thioredoxin reductase